MVAALVNGRELPPLLTCRQCGNAIATWDAERHCWQSLGAGFKHVRDERQGRWRPNFVCAVCGSLRRIPVGPEHAA